MGTGHASAINHIPDMSHLRHYQQVNQHIMTQSHQFLGSPQATITGQRVQHYGNPQVELQTTVDGTVLTDLSHLGLLQFDGEDYATFLQGQLTNDVKLLNGNNSHYAGYCTPKGRMLTIFLAFAQNDHLYLQLNRQLLEPIMKRLKMYVLRSKVTITDVSDSIMRLGIAGRDAEQILLNHFGQTPQTAHELLSLKEAGIIRLPGKRPRYEIFVASENAKQLWTVLSQQAQPVGAGCWDWLEIEAGIPDIEPATQEAFVPQMINLDALGGISFKKGCYTGQEIVARTHYLGKVKRRTLPLQIPSGIQAEAGNPIYADGEETVGMLVRVAPAADGGMVALAELRLEAVENRNIYLSKQAGIPLHLSELPYELPA
jgi:folate-binding protein YgfZ